MKLINAEYDQSVAPSLDLDEITRKSILDKYKLDNQNKIVVLCPDAEFGPAKRWPVKYWRELIKILNEDGFIPIILGKNTSLAEEISTIIHYKSTCWLDQQILKKQYIYYRLQK